MPVDAARDGTWTSKLKLAPFNELKVYVVLVSIISCSHFYKRLLKSMFWKLTTMHILSTKRLHSRRPKVHLLMYTSSLDTPLCVHVNTWQTGLMDNFPITKNCLQCPNVCPLTPFPPNCQPMVHHLNFWWHWQPQWLQSLGPKQKGYA